MNPRAHRLSLNENPYGPPLSVQRALISSLASINRYPESVPFRLPRLIAERLGCSPDQIVVGPGAAGVIMHVLHEFVSLGDNVVLADPTFLGYPAMIELAGGNAAWVSLLPDGRQDLAAMAWEVDTRTRVVVICDPHNPTGTRVDYKVLKSFLDELNPSVLVILDEAYVEFVPPDERSDALDLVARHRNLIVVRTFSKAFGLAALRVGYGIAAPDLATKVRRRQLRFEVNALAEVAVRACYAADDEMVARIATISDERDRLARALLELGFAVPKSYANFLFLTHPTPASAPWISGVLARSGIEVMQYPTGTRITIGDNSATDAVVAALRNSLVDGGISTH